MNLEMTFEEVKEHDANYSPPTDRTDILIFSFRTPRC